LADAHPTPQVAVGSLCRNRHWPVHVELDDRANRDATAAGVVVGSGVHEARPLRAMVPICRGAGGSGHLPGSPPSLAG